MERIDVLILYKNVMTPFLCLKMYVNKLYINLFHIGQSHFFMRFIP